MVGDRKMGGRLWSNFQKHEKFNGKSVKKCQEHMHIFYTNLNSNINLGHIGLKKKDKNMCKKIFKNEGKRSDCPYWLLK